MNKRMLARVSSSVLVIPLLLGGAMLCCPRAAPIHAAPAEARPTVDTLPLPVQHALSRDLGRDDPAYHFTAHAAGGYTATNPRTGLTATQTPSGMQVHAGCDTWSLALASWGRGTDPAVRPVPVAGPGVVQTNRLEVTHGALTAWYVNGPLGLQQGWMVSEPPPDAADAPVTLAFTQDGSLHGRVDADWRGLALAGAGGVAHWRYTDLQARDATGRVLPAWLNVDTKRVQVQVDDTGATYPLMVNAWVQAAKLTASDGADDDKLGTAVAVSGNGDTIVVGAPYHAAGGFWRGAAYVYTRSAGGWADATQTAKLTASGGADYDRLGTAVAVNADGSTVVVGAPYHDAGGSARGAAYVYVRPAGGWADATQTASLTASDGADHDHLGSAVAVSADSGTVVAGAPNHGTAGSTDRGAAYVYTRPVGGWADATQTAKLTASDGANSDMLGYSVAVNADGSTAVVDAPYHAAGGIALGTVYVYTRPPGGWADATQTARLTASDVDPYDQFGLPVAVSGDGGTVVAGARYNAAGGSDRGAAYVYARPTGGWADATQTAKLTASDGADHDYLGWSVTVSGDGGKVVAGAPGHAAGGSNRGAAYVYNRPETGWATTATFTAKLTASDGADGDQLGKAVAVSGFDDTVTGGTVAVGAPYHAAGGTDRGAAYVYTLAPNTPPTAAFTVTPTSGDTSTVFAFDASGCADAEDPSPVLEVRWDWEDDGIYDTPWSPTKTATHSYATTGTYTTRLQVIDHGGLTNATTRQVTVSGGMTPHKLFLPLIVYGFP